MLRINRTQTQAISDGVEVHPALLDTPVFSAVRSGPIPVILVFQAVSKRRCPITLIDFFPGALYSSPRKNPNGPSKAAFQFSSTACQLRRYRIDNRTES